MSFAESATSSKSCAAKEPPIVFEALLEKIESEIQSKKVLLDFDRSKIEACYMFGSRLYQSHVPFQSDFDFLVIVSDLQATNNFLNHNYKPKMNEQHYKFNAVKHELDCMLEFEMELAPGVNLEFSVHLLNTKYYLDLLLEHDPTMMTSLFVPKEYVYLEQPKIGAFKRNFTVSYRKIQSQFVRVAEQAISKSKRLFHEGVDDHKCKKNMGVAIRYLQFALQLINHESIVDFTQANQHIRAILQLDISNKQGAEHSWSTYFDTFYQLYLGIRNDFSTVVKDKYQNFKQKCVDRCGTDNPNIFDFLRHFQVEDLTRYYSIHLTYLSDSLVKLNYDPVKSFQALQLVRQSNHLILEKQAAVGESAQGRVRYHVKSYGLPSIPSIYSDSNHSRFFRNKQLDKLMISKKYVGAMINLYYNSGDWQVNYPEQEDHYKRTVQSNQSLSLYDTARQEYLQLFTQLNYSLPVNPEHQSYCFSFIKTDDSKLYLCSVRNLITLKEDHELTKYATAYRWKYVKEHNLVEYLKTAAYHDESVITNYSIHTNYHQAPGDKKQQKPNNGGNKKKPQQQQQQHKKQGSVATLPESTTATTTSSTTTASETSASSSTASSSETTATSTTTLPNDNYLIHIQKMFHLVNDYSRLNPLKHSGFMIRYQPNQKEEEEEQNGSVTTTVTVTSSGLSDVCLDDQQTRVHFESSLHYFAKQLNLWDVCVVRSLVNPMSGNDLPFQGVESQANQILMLHILRCQSPNVTKSTIDETFLQKKYTLFLPVYQRLKSSVNQLHQVSEETFLSIIQEHSTNEKVWVDKPFFMNKVLQSKFIQLCSKAKHYLLLLWLNNREHIKVNSEQIDLKTTLATIQHYSVMNLLFQDDGNDGSTTSTVQNQKQDPRAFEMKAFWNIWDQFETTYNNQSTT